MAVLNPDIGWKERLQKLKISISENAKKNLTTIGVGIYLIFYVFWNTAILYISGDINLNLFWTLLFDRLNMPVIIIVSLVLTGRWKGAIHDKEIQEKVAVLNLELELKKQELDHLREIHTQYQTIEELRKLLHYQRSLAEYKIQIAGIKGERIVDSLISNEDWLDSNDMLKAIDELKETVKEECVDFLEKEEKPNDPL